MIRTFIAALFCLIWANAALAFDVANMTDVERQQFRDEIRAYLLENPEVLVEAITILEQRQTSAQAGDDTALMAQYADALFNDPTSYVGGNPDGDIVIVEFLDYRCGYCKRAHPDVTELLATDGNIRYIIKEFPILGDQSTLASRFALSTQLIAGDTAYLAAHNALMKDQGGISLGSLRRLARTLGLDADAIINGMDAPEVNAILQANYDLGRAMQITGTPSFVLGDTMVRGYVPLATMQEMIAEQRG